MSIRKKSIISSVLVYLGFLIGAVNTYFYSRTGCFTPDQFGLTKVFFDLAQNMFAFAGLGVIPVVYKFYPYYKDNLEHHKIDLLTWAMVTAFIGFIIVLVCGIYFEPLIARKFSANSKLLVDYYYWVFPFALGMLLFSVLEGFSWAVNEAVISNFLKETLLRLITTVFILLYYFKLINFNTFIYGFAFLYLFIFVFLFIYLKWVKKLPLSFTVSRVTKKFKKKMFAMQSLIFSGTVIMSIAATIDSIVIAGFNGLTAVGVFAFAQYGANLIQVPQRSIQPVAAGVLSRAWKNMAEVFRIYQRSCINLLILSLFIFGNLWLNIKQGMQLVSIQKDFDAGMSTLLVLSLARIIDAGTGLNSFVINTSTRWRFDFLSGLFLLAFRLPLTWYLIKHYGIIGSAFADLTAVTLYNFVRYEFLRREFNMQPFTVKTLYAIVLALAAYYSSYYLLTNVNGWLGIFARSFVFSALIIAGTFYLQLTPDAAQLLDNLKKRFGSRK
jgi:O-antigen/teichoic acid export membrane protein